MTWLTVTEKEKQAQAQEIKAQLAALDEKFPRPLEIIIKSSPEALAEVIDAAGTTRGDILKQKQALRAELQALSI